MKRPLEILGDTFNALLGSSRNVSEENADGGHISKKGRKEMATQAFILFDPDVDGTTGALAFAHYLEGKQYEQHFDHVHVIPVIQSMLGLEMSQEVSQYGMGDLNDFLVAMGFRNNPANHLVFVDILPYNLNSNLTDNESPIIFRNTRELLPACCSDKGIVFVFDEHIRLGSSLNDMHNLTLCRVTPETSDLGLAASGLVYNFVTPGGNTTMQIDLTTTQMALTVASYADGGFRSRGRERKDKMRDNVMSVPNPDRHDYGHDLYPNDIGNIAVRAKDVLNAYYVQSNISRSLQGGTATFTPVRNWRSIFENIPDLRTPDEIHPIENQGQVWAESEKFDWLLPSSVEHVKLFHPVGLSEKTGKEWDHIVETEELVIGELSQQYVPYSQSSRCIIVSIAELESVKLKTTGTIATGQVKIFPLLRKLCQAKAPPDGEVNNIKPEWREKLGIGSQEAVYFILVDSFDALVAHTAQFGKALSGDARFAALMFGGNGHKYAAGCPPTMMIQEMEDDSVRISSTLLKPTGR